MLASVAASRDRCSEELDFEAAARQHERYVNIQALFALRDDLAAAVDNLHGIAITPAASSADQDLEAVRLWILYRGCWQKPVTFALTSGTSLDQRLREMMAGFEAATVPREERQEHLALLARWYFSTWRDGEWIGFESAERLPYRRLVRAVSRVAATAKARAGSGRQVVNLQV